MKRTFFSLKFKFYNFCLNKSKVWIFCLLPCLLLPAGCSKKNVGLSASEGSISNNIISESLVSESGRGEAEENLSSSSSFSGGTTISEGTASSDMAEDNKAEKSRDVKDSVNKPAENQGKKPADKPAIKKFNYDFTKMNYNMISSLLFDFIINPKKYADKTVKMDGQFETSVYENKRYFAVIKWDLTGCCPAGLDFEPPEDLKFPEDFPEKGTSITVSGVLKYQEDQEDNTALGKLNFVAYDMQVGQ